MSAFEFFLCVTDLLKKVPVGICELMLAVEYSDNIGKGIKNLVLLAICIPSRGAIAR